AYASLSHCWGTSSHPLTTKATLESRKRGFPVAELAQTFQDAIFVTRALGIRYLWIDSLCICQDDRADWERESAKMASVYSNAHITISAQRASDDSAGFLGERKERTYVSVPYTPEGVEVMAFEIPISHAAYGHRCLEAEEEPLSQRAWVLQERRLSPRNIHFGTREIAFECVGHEFVTEDGFEHDEKIEWFDIETMTPDPGFEDFLYRGPVAWSNLVRTYTNKVLTKKSDRLPAMAGFARRFDELWRDQMSEEKKSNWKPGGEYAAGLWRKNLVEGLAWQCVGGRGTYLDEYRAPSWSWASLEGDMAVSSLGTWTDLVSIEDVSVSIDGQNPYGEVSGGYIQLK
ncbi:HET-domain-containing protein, partial [Microthyrium microscopicum]